MHSPVTSAPDSDKQASTKSCQLSDGIGVRGGGGGGEGGGEGGEGAIQVLLIVSHEFAGPVTALVHENFARNAVASRNMSVCAVVAADPVHEEMSWLNAEANKTYIA